MEAASGYQLELFGIRTNPCITPPSEPESMEANLNSEDEAKIADRWDPATGMSELERLTAEYLAKHAQDVVALGTAAANRS